MFEKHVCPYLFKTLIRENVCAAKIILYLCPPFIGKKQITRIVPVHLENKGI